MSIGATLEPPRPAGSRLDEKLNRESGRMKFAVAIAPGLRTMIVWERIVVTA